MNKDLVEEQINSTLAYDGRFLKVRSDDVKLPDGKTANREYIVHPGAAVIVAILDDGRLILERQFRYPMGKVMIEFPAGKLDQGEPSLNCAVRELQEETGYRAAKWAFAGTMHNAIAYSDEHIDIWFAKELSGGQSQLDDGEFLEVFSADFQTLEQWILDGSLTGAKTMSAVIWLKALYEGKFQPDWKSAEEWSAQSST